MVKRFKCSMRSNPSTIACLRSLVVTSLCKSINDFDQLDFFSCRPKKISRRRMVRLKILVRSVGKNPVKI